MKFDNNCHSGFRKKSCLKLFKYAIFRYSNVTLVNRKKVTVTKLRYRFFFIFTILNTYIPLIFHAKIQPKMFSSSEEKFDFVIFAIFSNGGHLGYSTRLKFIILRPWWQVVLHVKFENCRCNSFIEKNV